MNALMKKLHKIQDECVEKQKLIADADDKADEFTRIRRKVAADLAEIRQVSFVLACCVIISSLWAPTLYVVD